MKRISKCQLWKLLKGYWASSNEDLGSGKAVAVNQKLRLV